MSATRALRLTRTAPAPGATRHAHTWAALIKEHLAWLAGLSYAAHTIQSRRTNLRIFAEWCEARNLMHPRELTLAVLESYRAWLTRVRLSRDIGPARAGQPLGWGSQAQRLLAVKRFCVWAVRAHVVAANPAAELELPRQPQRLPRGILSASEMERVLALPDVTTLMGLRDRAILETLYSTGIRREELINLRLADLDHERGTVLVREGKGKKDRLIPIGDRALAWIDAYATRVRPLVVVPPDNGALFLTRRGRRIRSNRLTELVHGYLDVAGLGARGSCHVFRHTMATLMLEGGADVRYIQEMLGHAQLNTTERYTRVAITQLKAVHTRTHPARLARVNSSSS